MADSLYTKFLAFQKSAPAIHKGATANLGGRAYKYADLPSIIDAARPALNAVGLVLTQTINGSDLVTAVIDAATGERLESRFPLPMEGSWHQIGAGISYARKYAIVSILGLAADDDDAVSTLPTKTPARVDRGDGGPVVALKRAALEMSDEFCDTCGEQMSLGPKTGKPFCKPCWTAKRDRERAFS